MGPVAHTRNVGSRSDHYRTTRGDAAPRLGRIDCKILSSSAREAATISRLINVLVSRLNYMHGGYGPWPRRDLPHDRSSYPRAPAVCASPLEMGVNLQI